MGWNYGIFVPGSGRVGSPAVSQVHPMLALGAATALGAMPADERSWVEVASVLSMSGGAP